MIRISPIRVIGPDNEQVGVIETSDALRMAQEHGLDLVEIAPDSRPPVCRIMDYGKYKYELSKREKKGTGKGAELKQIRLGRSVKIDEHDVRIRMEQARKFLLQGHKVQFTQRFRGREIMHKELGLERLDLIAQELSDIAKIESTPKWMGRQASIVLAPDKPKVDAYKQKHKRAAAEGERKGGAEGESEDQSADERPASPREAPETERETAGASADRGE